MTAVKFDETLLESYSSPTVPSNKNEIKIGTSKYLIVCGFAGSLVASGSNLLTTPLDVIKCRVQANSTKYPTFNCAFRSTLASDGLRGLTRGWTPILYGYGVQGFAKFGFYEIFKKQYSDILGPWWASKSRMAIYLLSGASAEAIADIGLAPFIAAKIRIQTAEGKPPTLRQTLPTIYRQEGMSGFFKGLPFLWMRQIPYTSVKFVSFEWCSEAIYKKIIKKDRKAVSYNNQMIVSFFSGIFAGFVAVVCSHPPDVIISQLYKDSNAKLVDVTLSLGFKGLWKGLGARIAMAGSIATIQLFIVDSVKTAFNLERPK